MRAIASLVIAAAPLGCATPPPPPANPFLGTWATAENNKITFRPDTVVQDERGGSGKAFDKTTCGGVFRFGYSTMGRDALTALVPHQPGLRHQLSVLLAEPRYSVAKLTCDQGDQTYVMLDDRRLVAIYRDGDIGGIERLTRR